MKQILLITDGCSNMGESPVTAAAQALAEGIVVNVAGVVDTGSIGEHGAKEIAEIARAGGGMSRIVKTRELSQTVQMLTRQTVAGTIRQAVNQELKQLFGLDSVGALPPEKRAEVVRVMDELEEMSSLHVALLIDASASMKPKLSAVEEAIRDLALSLKARSGSSAVAVFHYPADDDPWSCVMDCDWTTDADKLPHLFARLRMQGATPTGPALLQVVDYFRETYGKIKSEHIDAPPFVRSDSGEVRSDYVV
jgi:Ca-activated chloride channel family protein